MRNILIICNEAIKVNDELQARLNRILEPGDLADSSLASSTLVLATQVQRLVNELYWLANESRFNVSSERPNIRQLVRYSTKVVKIFHANIFNNTGQPSAFKRLNSLKSNADTLDHMLKGLRFEIKNELEAPPPDLSDIDLKGIQLSIDDLVGATWNSATVWPSDSFAAEVRAGSDEISPGVYRVRLGTEQHSFTF